jgi:hypothetical protein
LNATRHVVTRGGVENGLNNPVKSAGETRDKKDQPLFPESAGLFFFTVYFLDEEGES